MSNEVNYFTKEIGERLRIIADKFGGPSAFTKMLEMTPQQLNDYLSGRRIPGNKMRVRLEKNKIDTTWILTGLMPDKERQQKEIIKEIEMKKIFNYLELNDIATFEKIQHIYETYKVVIGLSQKNKKG